MRIRGTTREVEAFAREMRAAPTPSEDLMWRFLQRRPGGFKFRRQHALGRFVFDFVSCRPRLVIEIDGTLHETQRERDAERDALTRAWGYEVLRVTNDEVERDVEGVVERIVSILQSLSSNQRLPSSGASPA